jgi:hypothetical protein
VAGGAEGAASTGVGATTDGGAVVAVGVATTLVAASGVRACFGRKRRERARSSAIPIPATMTTLRRDRGLSAGAATGSGGGSAEG